LGNSRKEADAMPSDFRRLNSLTLARLSKGGHLQEIIKKEADLPAMRTTAEDPMNYHQ
jgi:hypothetical protein